MSAAPVMSAAAAVRAPATDALLLAIAPAMVAVVPADPINTDRELMPMRTAPPEATVVDVPASRTRSPPRLVVWPAAWPISHVERPAVVDDLTGRAIVNWESSPRRTEPTS